MRNSLRTHAGFPVQSSLFMTDSPSDNVTQDSQPPDSHPDDTRKPISRRAEVPDDAAGLRFDQIAAQLFPEFSRGRLKQWILSGDLTVDQQPGKPKQKLTAGSVLQIDAEFEIETDWQPEPLPLNILFEDRHVLIVNKSTGCVVHPAPGLNSGTLANAVLAHCPGNAELPRCGIVHRLDKDTTGLLVIAKSLEAHASLVAQLQARTVSRIYRAIVCGRLIAGGSIEQPIGRHATQRTKMAVAGHGADAHTAKPAITHYRVAKRLDHHTELSIRLETGRTHQIRVHMAHLRYPLLGDPVYNPRYRRPAGISDAFSQILQRFSRQALHATELSFEHPVTGKTCQFTAEPPDDYKNVLAALEDNQS